MSRYIDADAVVWEIEKDKCGLEDYDSALEVAIAEIKTFKTADVVEVVRCKDCIHHKPFPFSDEHICDMFDWESEDKDFCSFAERRTE